MLRTIHAIQRVEAHGDQAGHERHHGVHESELPDNVCIHLPWNGPFYASMGFKTLAVSDLNPRLAIIRQREALLGLPIERRVAMRADL